ncbi:hypothetical protein FSP39_018202 [Pinctada imbricata]|uniref:N-acetylglucosaminylphosphatidylinositol deacetylase n=1 Tax=Pinctada imbricata TaxID=66713 RepID=A0AA89BRH9_PINIB|nr:hypothetical protein FSP39_018202 [Pinctada imbricata]
MVLGRKFKRSKRLGSKVNMVESTGNFYGLGTIRSREILKSCAILGIPESHVHIFNDSSLPDSPVADWPISKIQDIILPVIYYLQPHSVITFDDYGVSGHKNHIAISKALRYVNFFYTFIRAFSLESCPLYRKYTSIIDLPLSFMVSDHMAVVSPLGFIRGLRAMLSHRSQMEWFRYLYILFSRYMLINTLQEIHHHGNYLWSSAAMETGKQQSK